MEVNGNQELEVKKWEEEEDEEDEDDEDVTSDQISFRKPLVLLNVSLKYCIL